MKITEESIIQRNNTILTSNLDGEKVMMSIKFGEYFGLGKTGSYIWDCIEKPTKVSDLADMIIQKYKVDKNKCLADILPFLNHLLEKELIIATK